MLSYEKKILIHHTTVSPSKYMSKKLDFFTSNLLETIQKQKKDESKKWAVVNLKGVILSSGSFEKKFDSSEFLF